MWIIEEKISESELWDRAKLWFGGFEMNVEMMIIFGKITKEKALAEYMDYLNDKGAKINYE